MAIAGGAVPTLMLDLQMDKSRLKVANAGSKNRDVVLEDISEICDKLQGGVAVYVNATGDRLRLVDAELQRRNVWIDVWPW